MKNLKLGLMMCLSIIVGVATAQTYDVTFSVDMAGYSEAFTTPTVNGSFGSWCGDCAPMTNTTGTIWETTVNIGAGVHDYKFAHDNWAGEESLFGLTGCVINTDGANFANRQIDVQADVVLSTVCWEECGACSPPAADVRITSIDITTGDITVTNIGNAAQDISSWQLCNFPAYASVTSINGSTTLGAGGSVVLNWSPAIDADGEMGLYSSTGFGDPANIVDYLEWASSGHTRASVAVSAGVWVAGDFVDGMPPYTFTGVSGDYGSAFWATTAVNYNLTLTVDMSEEGAVGPVNSVFGSFNGWTPGANVLTDNGDGTFSTTISVQEGTYEYKFHNDGAGALGEEILAGGESCTITTGAFTNRLINVTEDTTVPVVCWRACVDCAAANMSGCTDSEASNYNATATIDDGTCTYLLTLTVDLSNEGAIGPVNSVFGSFNGWTPGASVLTDNGDGTWSIALEVANGTYEYKFHNDGVGALGEEVFAGGEACTITTGAFTNRIITVEGNTTVDTVCWQACAACVVGQVLGCTDSSAQNFNADATEDNGTCTYLLTLSVDMTDVTEFTQPTVNGTFNGWCGNCNPLTDNGDGTWSTTLTVQNGQIEYKFAADDWVLEEDLSGLEGCVLETNGFTNRLVDITGDTTIDLVCWESCEACGINSGCTDPNFVEYNPEATTDDGSCSTLRVYGCAYSVAVNFNIQANTDDGSCTFELGTACPGDFDGSGTITSTDLTSFLSVFGQECE